MNHAEEGSNLRLLSESQANLAGCSIASGLKDGTVKEEDLSEDVKSFLKRVENLQGSSYKNKQKNVIAVCTVCSFCGPIHPSSLIVFVGVCLPPGVNPYSMLFMVVCKIFSLRLIVKITSGGENNFTSGGDFPCRLISLDLFKSGMAFQTTAACGGRRCVLCSARSRACRQIYDYRDGLQQGDWSYPAGHVSTHPS